MSTDLVPVTPAVRPQATWLVDQLPSVLADDDFLRRFLGIFEELTDSIMQRIDGFEHVVDPSVAPLEAVRWMGHWLGLDIEPTLPDDRQRRVLRMVGPLFAWRGTAIGLERLLEALTDSEVTVSDSGGVFAETEAPSGPKRVEVRLEDNGGLSDEQVAALLMLELPADVEATLRIANRIVPMSQTQRKSPRLEQAPSSGEQALMGFVTGDREGLAEGAFDEPPADEQRRGDLPHADDEEVEE